MTVQEPVPEPSNPMEIDGIEFIEYATSQPEALPGLASPTSTPTIAAMALRVRDAGFAYRRALDLGAWEIPTRASAMELNIPGIHGVGDSLVYFVDRYEDFSIYDVGFVALADPKPGSPALAGLHTVLPRGTHFGVLPNGTLLESPASAARVAERARRSVKWIAGVVSRRSLPARRG